MNALREKLVLDEEAKEIAQLLRDPRSIFRKGRRARHGIKCGRDALEFSNDSRRERCRGSAVHADMPLGEVALGQPSEANAKLRRFSAEAGMLGWCDAHGDNLRPGFLSIGSWSCHDCLLKNGFGALPRSDRKGTGDERRGSRA